MATKSRWEGGGAKGLSVAGPLRKELFAVSLRGGGYSK